MPSKSTVALWIGYYLFPRKWSIEEFSTNAKHPVPLKFNISCKRSMESLFIVIVIRIVIEVEIATKNTDW